ncbi:MULTISPECIES: DMT family transporter [Aminobacter]|uniref:Transporter family-2 protein n=1 Tax=Aminobacter niigataensis TaxID=83265 RepID=A0ABR6KXQ8_9HYPH|nr:MULTISPECIES: DMT family transporter [Aminobacter]AWC23955.1 hypothetical protein CO731_03428 [Aminobacter sp. MSH1]MBB4649210.1 transporter family-2 protein [Aminobacter niigataensis]CAI2934642.1 conserved membrane protein of unknown function [Aminobacter niigataensis]
MAGVLWSLLGVLAGAFVAIQAPVNAQLARGLGMPVAAAAVSFLAGAIVLGIIAYFTARAQGVSVDWRAPAPWLFVAGGCLGAVYVTSSVLLTPRIGAAALVAFLVTGQLLASVIVDRAGYFGVAVRELSMGRIVGAMLLLAGAMMIRIY